MKYLKKITAVGVSLIFALSLAACGGGTDAGGTASAQSTAGISESKKELIDFPVVSANNLIGGIAAIAKAEGYFEEEGLNVSFTYLSTNSDVLTAVISGKVKLSTAGGGSVAPWVFIEDGQDLEIIGGAMSEGSSIFAKKGSEDIFTDFTPEIMEGKKVAINRTSPNELNFKSYLIEKGVDLSKVEFVEFDAQTTVLQALLNGEVDLGGLSTNNRISAENSGLKPVLHLDEVRPNFVCCRINATSKAVNENRDQYVSYLRALLKAYKFYSESDRDAVLDSVTSVIDIDRDELISEMEYGHLQLSPDPLLDKCKEAYETAVAINYLDNKVTPEEHVDTSVYEDALNSIIEENPEDAFYKKCLEDFELHNKNF